MATLKAGSTRIHLIQNEVLEFGPAPGSSRSSSTARSRCRRRREREGDRRRRARGQLEAAQAELEKLEAGESTADRWQLEQRIKHAENQLSVSGRTTGRVLGLMLVAALADVHGNAPALAAVLEEVERERPSTSSCSAAT